MKQNASIDMGRKKYNSVNEKIFLAYFWVEHMSVSLHIFYDSGSSKIRNRLFRSELQTLNQFILNWLRSKIEINGQKRISKSSTKEECPDKHWQQERKIGGGVNEIWT